MRLAERPIVVHDWLTGMRGGEKVLEEVLALLPEAAIATLFHFPNAVSSTIEKRKIYTSPLQRFPGLRRHYRHYLPLYPWAVRRLPTAGHDLVVSVSHSVAKAVRCEPAAYHLCYCNSPMRYVWDQRREYFPSPSGPVDWVRERLLDRLRAWDRASNDDVDLFVANSSFVSNRIAHAYKLTSEVVHPPVHAEDIKPALSGSDSYLLAVSALVPYKRVDIAIRIAAATGRQLKVVGDGPDRPVLQRLATELGAPVTLCGRVPRSELVALYRGAGVFLQPGVEDFGISSVEALAAGIPVVARAKGGAVDIVRPGVDGILVEGQEIDEWCQAIDTAQRMRSNYLDRADRALEFSVLRFRQRIEDILRRKPTSKPIQGTQES